MRATVRKWGNSAHVRIPAAIREAANLRLDQPVDVREGQGRVIIEPVLAEPYDFAALVAVITDENRHGETDTGPAVGKEVW